jgi:glycosyltransferase involved in cell wall biosynthesis
MKLLVLTNLFPSPWDPRRAAYNRQQFEQLALDDEVTVLTAVDFRQRLRKRRGDPGLERVRNRPFAFVYPPGVVRAWQPSFLLASLMAQQGTWLRRQRFDCLLASWAFPDGVAVARLARRWRRPYAIKVHGNDLNVMANDPTRAPLITDALRGAAAVIAVSQALADKAVTLGVDSSRVHVIYNGVDAERFKPGLRAQARQRLGVPADGERILFVGNLKVSKGCIDLVDALPRVLRTRQRLTLAFLGDGPDRAQLVRRIESLGLDRQALVLGEVAHASLADQYRAADVVCLPSHNEGVPNVLLEAMACGVPVVASRVGGIPEVVPDEAGILVPVRDTAALSTALESALARTWDPAAIANHAKAFRWDQNIESLRRVLAEVVAGARRFGARHA